MSEAKRSVVVVTGGAQGIGRAIARALAEGGASVAVCDIDVEGATRTAREVSQASAVPAIAWRVDVSVEEDVERMADEVERSLGSITTWENNAAVTRPALLHKMEVADFDVVLQVHARGTFLGIREAARRMMATGTAGCILNVTSSAGLNGTIGQINYSAAKAAIVGMTKSAARELARYGIRVNAVAPVAATPMTEKIRTDPRLAERYLEQIPLRRFAEPDELGPTFQFLAGEGANYITGQVVCVDGGLYMAS